MFCNLFPRPLVSTFNLHIHIFNPTLMVNALLTLEGRVRVGIFIIRIIVMYKATKFLINECSLSPGTTTINAVQDIAKRCM